MYQGYEASYESSYITNGSNPHYSGGTFTIDIPANEAKSIAFDHMCLLGRFRVKGGTLTGGPPATGSAHTNLHMLEPMLLCYLKSFTIGG